MKSDQELLVNATKGYSALSMALIEAYQELDKIEKIKFLHDLMPHTPRISYNMNAIHDSFIIPKFFVQEYLDFSIVNFQSSNIFKQLIHYALYFALEDKEENFKEKQKLLDLLIEKGHLNPDSEIIDFPILHILAISNDLKTIQYLINLGAKTNIVDKSNDSLASSCLFEKENVDVFEYVINLPNFDPNQGKNVLSFAIKKGYIKSIDTIINSSSKLLSNQKFVDCAKKEYEKIIINEIMPQYEKILMEEKFCSSVQASSKIKI